MFIPFVTGAVRRFCVRIAPVFFLSYAAAPLGANVLYFYGHLRTDANVTSCGAGCTLGSPNTDGDYGQWAAVVDTFTVYTTTTMQAITYSYGGGTSLTGASVPAGGLEPYLSLFDSGGNFLASTFFGTTCPAGAHPVGGNCFDVLLDGGTLTPGVYSIALTAFENMSIAENNGPPAHLSDGFTGLGNLAAGENLNYAFDVILPTNTPEPGSLAMLGIGCAALALRKRLKQISNRRKL